jgi:hypothetical protein
MPVHSVTKFCCYLLDCPCFSRTTRVLLRLDNRNELFLHQSDITGLILVESQAGRAYYKWLLLAYIHMLDSSANRQWFGLLHGEGSYAYLKTEVLKSRLG